MKARLLHPSAASISDFVPRTLSPTMRPVPTPDAGDVAAACTTASNGPSRLAAPARSEQTSVTPSTPLSVARNLVSRRLSPLTSYPPPATARATNEPENPETPVTSTLIASASSNLCQYLL